MFHAAGKLVVCSSFENSAGERLSYSAPLLEEKRNLRLFALISNGSDPFCLHWPGARTAFAPNNYPSDAAEIRASEIFQQRFDRKESGRSLCELQVSQAR